MSVCECECECEVQGGSPRIEHEFLLIFIIYALAASTATTCPGAAAVHLLLWPRVYLNINQKVAMAAQVNITHTPRIRKSCSI